MDQNETLSGLLQECLHIINDGLQKTRTNKKFFIVFSVLCLLLAYFIAVIHIPYPIDFFVTFFRVVLVLMMGFGIVQSFIMIRGEVHGLEASRDDIKNLLRNIPK